MRLLNVGFILTLASISACRDTSEENGTPDAAGKVYDGGSGSGVSVAQYLGAGHKFPDPISVDGVIVVAKKNPSTTVAEFWVQDPGGGLSSGLHIYCNVNASSNPCATPLADIAALKVGDVLNLSGKFDNNDFNSHPDDFEMIQPVITKTGKTMTPTAMVIDATKVGVDGYMAADFTKIANTYVKVAGPITVTNLSSPVYGTTSCPSPDGGMGVDAGSASYLFGFEAQAGSTKINVGIRYPTFTSCMPDCDQCGGNSICKSCTADHHVSTSSTFTYLQGIAYGNRQQGMSFLEIQPTSDGDMPKQ